MKKYLILLLALTAFSCVFNRSHQKEADEPGERIVFLDMTRYNSVRSANPGFFELLRCRLEEQQGYSS